MKNKSILNQMFSRVPKKYDLINSVITLGQDKKWRRIAIENCLANRPKRVLDLCTGTGDLAVGMALAPNSPKDISAVDFTREMLVEAVSKAHEQHVSVNFYLADAASLPFGDRSFDAITISFGFRNLTYENANRTLHLNEIFRVLNENGRLVIVESSQPSVKVIRMGFKGFLLGVVGPMGGLISKDPDAYNYLARSSANFYTNEQIKALLINVGFSSVQSYKLMFGAAAVHVVTK